VELFKISRLWIERLALERSHYSRFDAPVAALQFSNPRFDLFSYFRRGWRSNCLSRILALVLGRIVAGGHVDAANRLAIPNGVTDHGVGVSRLHKSGLSPAIVSTSRRPPGKIRAKKAGIIA